MSAHASRRQLMGAGASMTLIPAVTTFKAAEPDRDLLAYCVEALAIDRHTERLEAANDLAALAAHLATADGRFVQLVKSLATMPARTPEGLLAKAEIGRRAMPKDFIGHDVGVDMVMSVLADVLGRAGA